MHAMPFDITAVSPNSKSSYWLDISSRADGGRWRLPVMAICGQQTGKTLVVTAGVHGDEYEGVEAIPQIYQQIKPDMLRGKLVMVPVCNMPAYEASQRSSPIDGLNLARVFPGDAKGSITQRIAYSITRELIKHADFYIDLHSGGVAAEIPTLIGYIHENGELGRQSQAAAKAFGAPVMWGHPLPVPPGRTISAATELNIPSLYTEGRGGGYARPDDVHCFTQGVINVMKHLDMLDGFPEIQPLTHHLLGDGNLDTVISAQAAGYFRASVRLLDEVSRGDRLGVVQNLFGEVVSEVHSDADGVVIMIRRVHRVHVGDGLVHLTNYCTDS